MEKEEPVKKKTKQNKKAKAGRHQCDAWTIPWPSESRSSFRVQVLPDGLPEEEPESLFQLRESCEV